MNLSAEQPQPQGITLDEAAERLMTPSEATIEEEQKEDAVPEVSGSEETTDEPEAEDTIEASSDDEEQDESATVEEALPEDIAELNEWLESSSDLYDDLVIPTKVNGEQGRVKLSELVKTYQIGESVEQRANEIKAKKAEFDEQARLAQQAMAERLEHAEQLSQAAEQFFTKQFEGVDWDDLRVTDPAEFSARKQEQKEVQQGLQSFRQNITQQRQQMINEQFEKTIQQESQRLLEAIPDWSDEQIAGREKAELRDYLLSTGLQPQEIDGYRDNNGNIVSAGIVDHRLIAIARKAMMFDKGNQKVEVAKKRVRNVPKMAKPGKAQSVESVAKAKDKAKRDRLRKSGKLEDAAALLFESMENL